MTKIYEALENAQRVKKGSEIPEIAPSHLPILSSPSKVTEWDMEGEIRLYQNLIALISDSGKKIIQFIGSREGEGTSTIAREFARASAVKFGKTVLLLDADRSHPSQHLFFGIKPEYGWEELVQGNGHFSKALYQIGESTLFISPTSKNSLPAPKIFSSLQMDILWKKLRERFDLILIDSPPATTSPDGLALSSKVDGVVLVLEAEKTRWPVAESVKEKIKRNGGNILGIVFNKRRYYIPEFIYKRL